MKIINKICSHMHLLLTFLPFWPALLALLLGLTLLVKPAGGV